MNKQRRNIIRATAMVVVASGLALNSVGRLAAQDWPNIDAVVGQFHDNSSSGEVEKNGAPVDESLVVQLTGGADDEIKGANWTVLQKVALAGAPGKDAIMSIAEIAPGAAAERHTHASYELGYVLKGEFVLETEGEAPRTIRASDSYAIRPARSIMRRTAVAGR